MQNNALVQFIIANEPSSVGLVGQPVFRLAAELQSAWSAHNCQKDCHKEHQENHQEDNQKEEQKSSANTNALPVNCSDSLYEYINLADDRQNTNRQNNGHQVEDPQIIEHQTRRDQPVQDQARRTLCLSLSADSESPLKTLGLACRWAPKLVLVEHAGSPNSNNVLEDMAFFSFGFRKLGEAFDDSGAQCRWFAYSLRDYKQPPDWLNSRFWAHPERFDIQD